MQLPNSVSNTKVKTTSSVAGAGQKLLNPAVYGQEEAAHSVRKLIVSLNPEKVESSPATVRFLVKLLQATFESKGDPQGVYLLLVENIDLIEPEFIYILRNWATHTFCAVSSEEATLIAGVLVDFAGIIWALPDGDEALNLEIAIACCETALQAFTPAEFPLQWATAHNNLAFAYSERSQGDSTENDRQAYAHYYCAKQIFSRQAFPQYWERIPRRHTRTQQTKQPVSAINSTVV